MKQKTVREGDVLWVHWPDLTGQVLLGRDKLQPYIDALIDRVGPDGKAVSAVNFVFAEHDAAAYNHDSLAFARIGVYTDGEPPQAFSSAHGDPGFSVREDGGIPKA